MGVTGASGACAGVAEGIEYLPTDGRRAPAGARAARAGARAAKTGGFWRENLPCRTPPSVRRVVPLGAPIRRLRERGERWVIRAGAFHRWTADIDSTRPAPRIGTMRSASLGRGAAQSTVETWHASAGHLLDERASPPAAQVVPVPHVRAVASTLTLAASRTATARGAETRVPYVVSAEARTPPWWQTPPATARARPRALAWTCTLRGEPRATRVFAVACPATARAMATCVAGEALVKEGRERRAHPPRRAPPRLCRGQRARSCRSSTAPPARRPAQHAAGENTPRAHARTHGGTRSLGVTGNARAHARTRRVRWCPHVGPASRTTCTPPPPSTPRAGIGWPLRGERAVPPTHPPTTTALRSPRRGPLVRACTH